VAHAGEHAVAHAVAHAGEHAVAHAVAHAGESMQWHMRESMQWHMRESMQWHMRFQHCNLVHNSAGRHTVHNSCELACKSKTLTHRRTQLVHRAAQLLQAHCSSQACHAQSSAHPLEACLDFEPLRLSGSVWKVFTAKLGPDVSGAAKGLELRRAQETCAAGPGVGGEGTSCAHARTPGRRASQPLTSGADPQGPAHAHTTHTACTHPRAPD